MLIFCVLITWCLKEVLSNEDLSYNPNLLSSEDFLPGDLSEQFEQCHYSLLLKFVEEVGEVSSLH